MQQVVDLQTDPDFKALGVQLLSISPDPIDAWRNEGRKLGITEPMLFDKDNLVWLQYGTVEWMMLTNEPGHTFVLVDQNGRVAWVRDYGARDHGGVMYVPPNELVPLIEERL